MTPTVGLIGYGRFGRLAARYLSRYAGVIVHDPRARAPLPRAGKIRSGTLREAAAQPVVLLAVPISRLRDVLRRVRRHVVPGAVVADVCSVKVFPLRWMREALPEGVYHVGTHPLFGPDSDRGSLKGQRVVLTPGNAPPAVVSRIRAFARRAGVRLTVMTPREHDRLMADTLLITHYVGRLVAAAGVHERAWSTASYDHLKALVRVAGNDSGQLFVDMWKFNPFGRGRAMRFSAAHRRLLKATGISVR
jgi:prephenate dehydrogenase